MSTVVVFFSDHRLPEGPGDPSAPETIVFIIDDVVTLACTPLKSSPVENDDRSSYILDQFLLLDGK